ncbi:hypothetical protein Fmac_006331 [Flemingia macrophylla]|uniref:Uncharacterized protein n=1 Tax=Flemingia macrophylla TaxID=520843 RepID=A0ABD1NAU7_9FABA
MQGTVTIVRLDKAEKNVLAADSPTGSSDKSVDASSAVSLNRETVKGVTFAVVDTESAFHASVAHFAESASPSVLLHRRTSLVNTATWSSPTLTTRTPRCGSCWDSRWRVVPDVGL